MVLSKLSMKYNGIYIGGTRLESSVRMNDKAAYYMGFNKGREIEIRGMLVL